MAADLQKAQQIYDSMSAEQRKQFEQKYGGEQKAQDFLQSQNTNKTQNTVKTQSTPTAKTETQPQQTVSATTQQGRPELLPESYYKDDTDKRQNEIISNLNQAVYQNPQSLSDYNTFSNYYNYEGRTDLQKQTLDNRYKGYQKSQEYSTKSVKELQSLYNANVMSQNDLSILKMYDPNKYNELNNLITRSADMNVYASELSGPKETINPFQGIIDNFIQGLESFSQTNFYDEYRDTINSPALKQKNQEIIAEQAEMDRLDLLINNKRKDVEERYAGTGATKSKIAAIIADETYELQLDKANRAITLNAMVNSYNAEIGNAREELNLKLQEYNMGLQQRQQQMQELGFAMSLMNFETNAQRDEREWNNFIRQQEYQNGDIFSNDPRVRNKAIEKAVDTVLQEFSGIPMLRSREQMIEDITGLVNGGMSLGQAITKNIREPIMNKDEYKQRHSQTFGEKAPQIYNIGGNDYVWNEKTGAFESVPTYDGPTGMSEFIGRWEGFRENAYQDVGGVWTIGYGFTKVNGVPVKAGDKITREQADVEFQKQISQYQNWRNYITTPLSEAQETALTSFEYNLGQGIWTKSVGGAMGVIDSINNGDLQGAADLMKKFNKAKIDGVLKEVKGLSNRRNEEAQLLMQTGAMVDGVGMVGGYNPQNVSSFQSFLDGDRKPAVFGGSQAERQQSLQDMGYSSWSEFYKDYSQWEREQVEAPSQIFISAAKFVKDNPLFNYTDKQGVEHKGILGDIGTVDTKFIEKIQSNISQGKARDSGTLQYLALYPKKWAKIGQFVNAFETIKASKVIDIVRTGEIKLHPMSDSDVQLIADSTGFKIGNMTIPDTATEISRALSNLGSAYSTEKGAIQGESKTQYLPVALDFDTLPSINTLTGGNISGYDFNLSDYVFAK